MTFFGRVVVVASLAFLAWGCGSENGGGHQGTGGNGGSGGEAAGGTDGGGGDAGAGAGGEAGAGRGGEAGAGGSAVPEPPVGKITVSPESSTVKELDKVQLTAAVFGEDDQPLPDFKVRWESDDDSVAAVSSSGLVTAQQPGTAAITATAGEKSAKATIVIERLPVASVTIDAGRWLDLDVGTSFQLQATPRDADGRALAGRTVHWSTPDPSLSIDKDGVVSTTVPMAWTGGEVRAQVDEAEEDMTVTFRLRFKTLSSSNSAICGLDGVDRIWCWGKNAGTSVDGDGHTSPADSSVPVPVAPDRRFRQLSISSSQRCALDSDQRAWCWGAGLFGNLGSGETPSFALEPQRVAGEHVFQSLAAASSAGSCAVDTEGKLWCWGRLAEQSAVPVHLQDGLRSIQMGPAAMSAQTHLVAVNKKGDHLAWGLNTSGELFPTEGASVLEPLPLLPGKKILSLGMGVSHLCAVVSGSSGPITHCQGKGDGGETGNSTLPARDTGNEISNPALVSVYAHASYNCGLTEEGVAYCWGVGSVGQLGNGSLGGATPKPVSGDHRFSTLSLGRNAACGVTVEQETYCWGSGGSGQLGNDKISSTVPVLVTGTSK